METSNVREGQKPTSNPGGGDGGGGMARVASMVAAGKRLAMTVRSPRPSQPSRSFRFNDNGSMVDLQCQDHATFPGPCSVSHQCAGRSVGLDRAAWISGVTRTTPVRSSAAAAERRILLLRSHSTSSGRLLPGSLILTSTTLLIRRRL